MFAYKKYLIREKDQFDPEQFSFLTDDIAIIKDQIEHVPPFFRTEILVGFMKNHSLNNEWKNVNPQLAEMVSDGSLSSRNIESLFESCAGSPVFRQQLEEYLKRSFSE